VLRFRVLGPFEVEDDSGPLDLGSERRRALLALLTLNAGRVVGVDHLVDALWGDAPPRTATHVLHVYVSDLRRVLPGDVLATVTPGYVLRVPSGSVDLATFEDLASSGRAALDAGDAARATELFSAGLALWRGPVLADLAEEGFVRVEARRLEELRLQARELWAVAALQQGGATGVLPELVALTAEQPLRERPYALLMRALAADGRQAEALEVYDSVRARLADELGIDPGEELRSAQAAVLRQEVSSGRARVPLPPRPGVVLVAGATTGRLAALARVAAGAAAGAGRELVVAAVLDARQAGPADVGAAATSARAAQRGATANGRSAAFRSQDLARDLPALAAEHDADLVVLDAGGSIGPQGRLAEWLLLAMAGITADVALLADGEPPEGVPFTVPFGGTDHDWAAAELAALTARATGRQLRVVGAVAGTWDASRLVARLALAVQRAVGVDVEPVLAPPTDAGLAEALTGSAAVVGLSDRWRSEGLGPFRLRLATATPGTLVVRRGLRPGLLAPASTGTRFGWSAVRERPSPDGQSTANGR
jgi:DNA-binding SARP family transcriptional activator